jgi:thiamine-phosphate pyrophosphorylase
MPRSICKKTGQPLPPIWLISDARNDAVLERALMRLPRGSGFIFRHYHLASAERQARFRTLARIARRCGHVVVLAGTAAQARRRGADGAYGANLHCGPAGLRLVTAHGLRDLRRAARADLILLSPVFQTRSHPGAKSLGSLRFRLLAARSRVPVIALGGMNRQRAAALGWPRWAAIDAFLR